MAVYGVIQVRLVCWLTARSQTLQPLTTLTSSRHCSMTKMSTKTILYIELSHRTTVFLIQHSAPSALNTGLIMIVIEVVVDVMRYINPRFYRAKPSGAQRGIAKASCLSVLLSGCDVEVSCSYRLEFLENILLRLISLTFPLSADTNVTNLF